MSFREKSLESENYLKSFLTKINVEFAKSLPSVGHSLAGINEDDADFSELLLEAEPEPPKPSTSAKPEPKQQQQQVQIKEVKQTIQETKKIVIKSEKLPLQISTITKEPSSKDYLNLDESEERIEDDSNIFGEEIYDIMEIDGNEEADYLDDASNKQVMGDDDNEFILVNFKSSSEDLNDTQFVVEELYESDKNSIGGGKVRRKTSNRMPKEIVEKYAQSTSTKQHICTKCVKVFSTRTNLIRHIQSHDGFKPYVCEICDKGFTQSGSLKQHMYIHSGERPYKCKYCDRAFTQGKTLKFHLRRHTEEKPFTCGECYATFRQRDGLKRHLKAKHSIDLIYERPNQVQLTEDTISQLLRSDDKSGTGSSDDNKK